MIKFMKNLKNNLTNMKKYDKMKSTLVTFKNKIKDWWAIKKVVKKALDSKGFLITISYKIEAKENGKDLKHFWIMKDFPINAILSSLSTIYKDLDKKEITFREIHDFLEEKK